jgi:hypothetical protein
MGEDIKESITIKTISEYLPFRNGFRVSRMMIKFLV